jgi:hypothetical protein
MSIHSSVDAAVDNYARSAAASSRQLPEISSFGAQADGLNLEVPVEFRSMIGRIG